MRDRSALASSDRGIAADIAAIARIPAVTSILEVACRATKMRFAAVARVTEQQWVACAVRDDINFGLQPGGELEVESTLCHEVRQRGELVVIDHVATDPQFHSHHTPRRYGFQSYISVPITLPNGRFFGTLCAIDPDPVSLKHSEAVAMFELFANLIAFHLDAQERVSRSETALLDEQEQGELQQQFMAVLGHDLRNPLSAIQTGVNVLRTRSLDEVATQMTQVIDRSGRRMLGLIDDVLDFARSRLGPGLPATLRTAPDLQAVLEQVTDEIRTAQPKRTIDSELALARPVVCDSARIAQLLSNLLGNALTHGSQTAPVWVRGHVADDTFELSVANHGPALSQEITDRMFQPFARGSGASLSGGLGLGLFIASQIARAHGGTLRVQSTVDETRFTFRMPIA